MGKLRVVGIGFGSIENMSLRVLKVIEDSDVIVGYNKYIDMIKELVKDKELYLMGMKVEEDRCKEVLSLCKNKNVVLISIGDVGIYGMVGLIFEFRNDEDVEIILGIIVLSVVGFIIGVLFMYDNCNISLSDFMILYEDIKKRVKLVVEGDYIILLYNFKSKGRLYYLRECIDIIKEFREDIIFVVVVRYVLREG